MICHQGLLKNSVYILSDRAAAMNIIDRFAAGKKRCQEKQRVETMEVMDIILPKITYNARKVTIAYLKRTVVIHKAIVKSLVIKRPCGFNKENGRYNPFILALLIPGQLINEIFSATDAARADNMKNFDGLHITGHPFCKYVEFPKV